jgi:hypothetical protein
MQPEAVVGVPLFCKEPEILWTLGTDRGHKVRQCRSSTTYELWK